MTNLPSIFDENQLDNPLTNLVSLPSNVIFSETVVRFNGLYDLSGIYSLIKGH